MRAVRIAVLLAGLAGLGWSGEPGTLQWALLGGAAVLGAASHFGPATLRALLGVAAGGSAAAAAVVAGVPAQPGLGAAAVATAAVAATLLGLHAPPRHAPPTHWTSVATLALAVGAAAVVAWWPVPAEGGVARLDPATPAGAALRMAAVVLAVYLAGAAVGWATARLRRGGAPLAPPPA